MDNNPEIFDRIDLELLRTIEAVYLERNIARAALRLNVSQPLVSRRLTSLRLLFRDQLFVRAPHGVAPTEFAKSLAPSIHRALSELRESLQGARKFDPVTADRQFTIHMSDSAELAFLVPLYRHLRKHYPRIRLKCVRLAVDVVPSALENQRIHMAIGVFPQLGPEFERTNLVTQDYQLVMGRSHPRSRENITAADLSELDYLMIGNFHDVENMMAEHGLSSRIRHRIGHYLAAPHLLAEGSLAAWLPRSIIEPMAIFGEYRSFSPLSEQKIFSVSIIRTTRSRNDPGILWMWETIVKLIHENARSLGTSLHT